MLRDVKQAISNAVVPGLMLVLASATVACGQDGSGPLKVFILAGQSNMEGHGAIGTLDWLGEDPVYGHLLAKAKNEDGSWKVRDDVWVYYPRARGGLKKGALTVGFGAGDQKIGPELMFGHVMGDYYDNQVLLIKTAWGGKSLAVDFRPPGSGGQTGPYYEKMLEIVRDVLGNLKQHFPQYDGEGYEIAGFVWFQGWNDMINADRVAEYETNMVNLIKDLRKDLEVPRLPVVIGELGVGGEESAKKNVRMANIRKAQAAAADRPEFQGSVAFVATSKYWDEQAHALVKKYWIRRKWVDEQAHAQFQKMGSQPPYHYLGSGKIYSLIGYGFGEAMKQLSAKPDQNLETASPPARVNRARRVFGSIESAMKRAEPSQKVA